MILNDSETFWQVEKLLEGIVKFGRTEASQIMKPRIEMAALDADSNFKEVLAFVLDAGYSRIPVYKENTDNVIGILYIKDLLPYLSKEEDFNWITVIRKPFFIPENKKINDLLQEFRSMKMHLAVVVDEYGGASGIITLEFDHARIGFDGHEHSIQWRLTGHVLKNFRCEINLHVFGQI